MNTGSRIFFAATIFITVAAASLKSEETESTSPSESETAIQLKLLETLLNEKTSILEESLTELQNHTVKLSTSIEEAHARTQQDISELQKEIFGMYTASQERQDAFRADLKNAAPQPFPQPRVNPLPAWLLPGLVSLTLLVSLAAALRLWLTKSAAAPPLRPVSQPQASEPAYSRELALQLNRLPVIEEKLLSIERTLGETTSNTASSDPFLVESLTKLLQRIPEPAPELIEEKPDELLGNHHDLVSLLPIGLHAGEKLSAEYKKLEMAAFEGDSQAKRLIAALIDWQACASGKETNQTALLMHKLGQRLFAFLHATAARQDDQDRVIESIQAWTKYFKIQLEEHAPGLRLIAIYPNDRFNTDRMEAVRSHSGGRLTVAFPLSWLIIEQVDSGERVVHRAEVITS